MVTSLFAALLGILYFNISLTTIKGRRSQKVSLGSGENNEILHLVSAHSNFSSYVPIFLILFYLLEQTTLPSFILYILGGIFTLGRILHFISLKNKEKTFTKRVMGMRLTLMPLMICSLLNLFYYIKGLLANV